ncbi:MAG: protein TolR [Rickettsiales bacterium]|nr:protein TolR [Rickettsiales bacterium]|tara:strand:- start:11005 stop:11415 length:411 start_codon:yes stop_codon:yes gene_type:complete
MRKSRFSRQNFTPISSINVTPFVDVVLVLLIVFMISAPLINVGVEVSLPKTKAAPIKEKSEPVVISYQKNGNIYIQEKKTTFAKLIPQLKTIIEKKPKTEIFIRGDKGLSYGKIMDLTGRLSQNGFEHISLVTDPI